jgi:diaminohydroxyphosphoribosylaminopyrimidine deaminase/5-amino-6-(5-phosphoribosylamino)uracil reductase
MRRAIDLASARMGTTWPNPTVGCVIARGEAVIAEAATGPGGAGSAGERLHAEEQALIAAGDAARGACAYITLEPCARRSSERLSCTDRLIQAGVARVFTACRDPSPNAHGQGLARLSAAGVAVEADLIAGEAEALYRGYRHRVLTGRPMVVGAPGGAGFDAEFTPLPGEELGQAMTRFGQIGYTLMWVKAGGMLESTLLSRGMLN